MSGFWELNVMEGKNPTHTGAFLTAYDQREFTAEQIAAREGGQNALDAGKNVHKITRLEFHKLSISGEKKSELLKLFEFEELLSPRLETFEENERTEFFAENVRKFLSPETSSALLIRDFNTCGLGGAWDKYEKEDHFARLVCALNLDDKADGNSNSGGSYGLGKTVYAKSSLINTVLYHSTFQPTSRSNDVKRRLMVSGIYPRHTLGNTDYGGFAYFGKEDPQSPKDPQNPVVMPFEDNEAQKLWNRVGDLFGVDLIRGDEDHGTDVLILMDSLDLTNIKKAIEDYYFPALIDEKLDVKFFDEHRKLERPQPHDRKDLDQFIRLIKDAKGSPEEKTDRRKVANLKRLQDHKLGRIAFEAAEDDEAMSEKNNCVAIMRGTGMIINYLKLGSERYEAAVGAFVAHEDVWKYLIASENAAHSEWSENSRRLHQDFSKAGKDIVGRLNRTVKRQFNNFQKSLQPDVTTTRSESGLLAKLLSRALTGSAGDAPVPAGEPNPVRVSLTHSHREESISVWRLSIRQNEHTPEEPFNLTLYPSISLAGDSKQIAIKHMVFSIKNSDGKILAQEAKPGLDFPFERGEVIDLTVEFDNPGRKNFIVHCKCVAIREAQQ